MVEGLRGSLSFDSSVAGSLEFDSPAFLLASETVFSPISSMLSIPMIVIQTYRSLGDIDCCFAVISGDLVARLESASPDVPSGGKKTPSVEPHKGRGSWQRIRFSYLWNTRRSWQHPMGRTNGHSS